MTNWRATARWVVFAALALPAAAQQQQQPKHPAPLSAAARELLALCDEFDPWPPGGYPCVRVWTDHWTPIDAWLLDRSAGTCLVRTEHSQCFGVPFDGSIKSLTYASWEPGDLSESLFVDGSGSGLGWLQRARTLAERGDPAMLEKWAPGDLHAEAWLNAYSGEFAIQLIYDFLDPRCSWPELLARHDRWLARFGKRTDHDYLEAAVAPRRADIAEVVAALAMHPGPGQAHTPADLVFDLHHEFSPRLTGLAGELALLCGPTMPRERTRPADRVLAVGLSCVPFLIAALDDQSPSRCVGSPRSSLHQGPDRPVPFGTIADLVLTEMAGGPPEGLDPRERAAHWNRWYTEARRRGLRVMLEERVAKREPFAMVCFARQYPDDVAKVFAAAHRGDPQDEATLWLVLRELPGRVPDALVAEFVDRVPYLDDLDVALPGLWRLVEEGHPEIVLRAIDHWRTLLRVPGMAENGLEMHDWLALGRAAGCWREVWTMLAEIGATAKGRLHLERFLRWHPSPTYLKPLAEDPIAREPLRTCLRALLDANDREFAQEHTFVCRGVPLVVLDATIADLAEWALAELWPDQPAFDARRTSSVRERTRRNGGVAPARDPASLPANLVREVVIDGDLARQPPERVRVLRALEGRILTRPALLAALQEFRQPRTRSAEDPFPEAPTRLVGTVERTRFGEGIVLRFDDPHVETIDALGGIEFQGNDPDAWSLDVSVVVAGRRVRLFPAHADWRDWVADRVMFARRAAKSKAPPRAPFVPCEIDAALALPATTGFEMRLTLHEAPR